MENKPKIRTHGFELFVIVILGFVVMIVFIVLAYRVFILERLKKSPEYQTANYYLTKSKTLILELAGEEIDYSKPLKEIENPIEHISLDKMDVNEKDEYGYSNVSFHVLLKNGLNVRVKIALARYADFWIVAGVNLNPGLPHEIRMSSTYDKILVMLERIDFNDAATAAAILGYIKSETWDAKLVYYLDARVNYASGNFTYAAQKLDDLLRDAGYARLAVMYERARVHLSLRDDASHPGQMQMAIQMLLDIESLYEKFYAKLKPSRLRNFFSSMPKDQLIASLDAASILASSRRTLSLAYYFDKKYDQSLSWAEKTYDQAKLINSAVLMNDAEFIMGQNLYYMARYDEADVMFDAIIRDAGNANLVQKAWSYYFRADIAARLQKNTVALDFYEMAISLDPLNETIRRAAIRFLVRRNYTGDLEIALGWALRGVDYETQGNIFKQIASKLYSMLGLRDKTQIIQ